MNCDFDGFVIEIDHTIEIDGCWLNGLNGHGKDEKKTLDEKKIKTNL